MTRAVKIVVVSCVIAAIFLPILVHVLFSVAAPIPLLEAKWNAGDLLAYISTFFAAGAALLGVVLTIKHSDATTRVKLREESAPYIAIVYLERKGLKSHLEDDMLEPPLLSGGSRLRLSGLRKSYGSSQEQEFFSAYCSYKEFECKREYVIVDRGVSFRKELDDALRENVLHLDSKVKLDERTTGFTPNAVVYQPVLFRNVGLEPAINVQYSFYKKPIEGEERFVSPRTLSPRDEFYVGLYINTEAESVEGDTSWA